MRSSTTSGRRARKRPRAAAPAAPGPAPARAVAAGLSGQEARERLARVGRNVVPSPPADPLWRRFVAQFKSPLIYVLLVALILDVALTAAAPGGGIPVEAIAIGAILVLNAGLGTWHEHRARGALAGLRALAAPQALVIRDGAPVRVAGTELVPGDLVRLAAGDRVPADVRVTAAADLLLDESILTGESLPVERAAGDELLAGTLVTRGRAAAEVARTGTRSALGRIAHLLATLAPEPTPLERRLDALGARVARAVIVLAVVLGAGGLLMDGGHRQAVQIVMLAAALAVAAVPEGLPAVLTVTLSRGVLRMARRRAVVRRLAAVETLGSVTVIATDKTGTLTEGHLHVRELDAPDRRRALEAMVLAGDADALSGVGDPIELALLHFAESHGGDAAALHADQRRRSGRTFDAAWKYTRATLEDADGRVVSWCKGAPEIILARCAMPAAERDAWREKLERRAAEGYRVVGLASADGEREDDLTWLGLALLWDPPRPEVPAAVATARALGVRVIMITGDHAGTARTVAARLGLPAARVVTGAELDALDAAGLARLVADVDVVARAAPEHKLRIVEALRAAGETVAVTGDGVNDALALQRADVGVAMGRRGSDVAREAADIVLLDDNFATIVAAIEEGRLILANIRKVLRFLFSTNLAELAVVVAGGALAAVLGSRAADGALLLPLTAAQLLWVNLVTDGLPAVGLGVDRAPTRRTRAPSRPNGRLLDRESVRFVVLAGLGTAALALAGFAGLAAAWRVPTAVTTTATFMFVGLSQLALAYPARAAERTRFNGVLLAAVLAGAAAQVATVLIPAARGVFATAPLSLEVWGWVAGGVALAWVWGEAVRRAVRPAPRP